MRMTVTALLLATSCMPLLAQQRAPLPMSVPLVTYGTPQTAPVISGPVYPPVPIERPPVVTACDTGGCWDSNGTRLNRAGPALVGPSGVCTAQGNVLACPP